MYLYRIRKQMKAQVLWGVLPCRFVNIYTILEGQAIQD